jgi:hypothetical protein
VLPGVEAKRKVYMQKSHSCKPWDDPCFLAWIHYSLDPCLNLPLRQLTARLLLVALLAGRIHIWWFSSGTRCNLTEFNDDLGSDACKAAEQGGVKGKTSFFLPSPTGRKTTKKAIIQTGDPPGVVKSRSTIIKDASNGHWKKAIKQTFKDKRLFFFCFPFLLPRRLWVLSSLQVIGKKDLWSIGAFQASKSSSIARPVRSVQSMTFRQTPIHGCGATAQPETEMAPGSRFVSFERQT